MPFLHGAPLSSTDVARPICHPQKPPKRVTRASAAQDVCHLGREIIMSLLGIQERGANNIMLY